MPQSDMLKSCEDGRCCVMFYFLFYYSKKNVCVDPSSVLASFFFAAQYFHLEKTLESPLACKEVKPVNPKGNQPEDSLEGLMLKLQ